MKPYTLEELRSQVEEDLKTETDENRLFDLEIIQLEVDNLADFVKRPHAEKYVEQTRHVLDNLIICYENSKQFQR
jgi:hypothetical protein